MLPQPFVTTAQAQSENLRVALDLTEEWDDACRLTAKRPPRWSPAWWWPGRSLWRSIPRLVSDFLDHYQQSVEYVNANVEDAAQLVGQYDIVTAEVAQKAIPGVQHRLYRGGRDEGEAVRLPVGTV